MRLRTRVWWRYWWRLRDWWLWWRAWRKATTPASLRRAMADRTAHGPHGRHLWWFYQTEGRQNGAWVACSFTAYDDQRHHIKYRISEAAEGGWRLSTSSHFGVTRFSGLVAAMRAADRLEGRIRALVRRHPDPCGAWSCIICGRILDAGSAVDDYRNVRRCAHCGPHVAVAREATP